VVVLPPTADDFDRDFDRFFLFFPMCNENIAVKPRKRADQTRDILFIAFFLRVAMRLDLLTCSVGEFVLDFPSRVICEL